MHKYKPYKILPSYKGLAIYIWRRMDVKTVKNGFYGLKTTSQSES